MIQDPDYARIFTKARIIAWQEGYALAVHGSTTRDLDLLAVPWTENNCSPERLTQRIAGTCDLGLESPKPSLMPHNRKTWTLIFKEFGDPRWIDLSVICPTTEPTP